MKLRSILTITLLLPILCVSQPSEELSLPKWVKFQGIDAALISIPQMDSITIAFLERDFYKKKIETNNYDFLGLILDIEKLEETVRLKDGIIKNKNLIISEKDLQIKTLTEQREIDELSKPSFWQRISDWVIGFAIGAVTTLVLTTI